MTTAPKDTLVGYLALRTQSPFSWTIKNNESGIAFIRKNLFLSTLPVHKKYFSTASNCPSRLLKHSIFDSPFTKCSSAKVARNRKKLRCAVYYPYISALIFFADATECAFSTGCYEHLTCVGDTANMGKHFFAKIIQGV